MSGGPARPGPTEDLRPSASGKPGGTSARALRGARVPHRDAQVSPAADPHGPVSYYGQPVIKPPVWRAYIPWYFFFGGLVGASAPLAAVAGVRGNRALERRAWATALAALAVSPVLLIADLGRPERFHHMLRVAKVTSPMSVGTWTITVAGPATGLAAARSLLGWFPRAGAAGAGVAAVLGPLLSAYTAVLVADTAVPAWHGALRELPFVFAGSSAASAGGAGVLLTPVAHAGPARRLAVAGAIGELAAVHRMERSLGELAEPYRAGTAGRLARTARACTAAGAGILAVRGGRRLAAAGGGALLLAGAALQRWAVFKAGIASAEDPRYTVGPQRARVRAEPRVSRPAAPRPDAGRG